MAKNTNSNYRIGAVKTRSQVKNPVTNQFVKRDAEKLAICKEEGIPCERGFMPE